MVPDMNIATEVTREIVRDRIRENERRMVLKSLPQRPTRARRFTCTVVSGLGRQIMRLGTRMMRYGESEFNGMPATAPSHQR